MVSTKIKTKLNLPEKRICTYCGVKFEIKKREAYPKCADCIKDRKQLEIINNRIKERRAINRTNMNIKLPCELR